MKLKPCPFCGKLPIILPLFPEEEGDAWTEIVCEYGKCPSNPSVKSYSDIKANHRRGAQKKWNRRYA